MDLETQKVHLISQIHGYESILGDRGIPYPTVTEDELKAMEITDLKRTLREVKDLARTPH